MHKMIFINLRLLKIDYKIQHTIAFFGFWFKKKLDMQKKMAAESEGSRFDTLKVNFKELF